MQTNHIKIAICVVSVCLTACLALVARGDDAQVKGMIISRTGETLIVRGQSGQVTVVLTEGTRTKDDKGMFALDKEEMADTVLIPGLKVQIDGTPDNEGRVVAKVITVDGDDLETSEMIQSGLHPTAEQVAASMQAIDSNKKSIDTHGEKISAIQKDIDANRQTVSSNKQQTSQNIKDIEENTNRFTALADYDVKAQATVKFDVASSKLSPEDLEELKNVAQTATGLTGYIIEVTGYADSTGSAAMNTRLSEERAKAVISVLMQLGGVPVRHIVAPGAMGEYGAAAPNETKEGRAENRRVEVKVLVNKGITGT